MMMPNSTPVPAMYLPCRVERFKHRGTNMAKKKKKRQLVVRAAIRSYTTSYRQKYVERQLTGIDRYHRGNHPSTFSSVCCTQSYPSVCKPGGLGLLPADVHGVLVQKGEKWGRRPLEIKPGFVLSQVEKVFLVSCRGATTSCLCWSSTTVVPTMSGPYRLSIDSSGCRLPL